MKRERCRNCGLEYVDARPPALLAVDLGPLPCPGCSDVASSTWLPRPTEFREVVRRMRDAQRSYFKGRNELDLARAKRYERLVDRELEAGPIE